MSEHAARFDHLPSGTARRHEIDGLRAAAVLPIVLFHAKVTGFGGGYIGVDVFFVISGYLLTLIIADEMREGRFGLLRFWERRARRILPALIFVVLWSTLAALILLYPHDMRHYAQSLVAVGGFASNVFFWLKSGYFDPGADLQPLLHTWSLGVEEQFYFVYPLLMLCLWGRGRSVVFWVLLSLAVVSVILAQWTTRDHPLAGFYLPFNRAWQLLVGALIALAPMPAAGVRSRNLLSFIGLSAILAAVAVFDETTPVPGVIALLPVAGTALVLRYARAGTLVGWVLSRPPLVGIGLISYSLYLWHQPLLVFARFQGVDPSGWPFLLAYMAVLLGLSVLTWRFVENPFRRAGAQRPPPQRFLGFSIAAMVCLITLGGALLVFQDPLTRLRLSEDRLRLLATAAESPARQRCHSGQDDDSPADQSCVYLEGAPTWAVLGNSHGVELAYGLAHALQAQNTALYHMTITACGPGIGDDSPAYCNRFLSSRLSYLEGRPDITTVVLSFRTEYAGPGGSDALIDLANRLSASGRRVILVLQAPTLPRHVTTYFATATKTGEAVGRPRAQWRQMYANILDRVPNLSDSVIVVDPSAAFCNATKCFAVRNEVALYTDDHHMSVTAAKLVADLVLKATSDASMQSP